MDDNEPNATVRDSQDYSNGTFYDATGDPNTNAHSVADGKVNTALSFDGIDDYIDTNDTFQSVFSAEDSNGFTLTFWAKPQLPENTGYFLGSTKISGGMYSGFVIETSEDEGVAICYDANHLGSGLTFDDSTFFSGGSWTMLTTVFQKISDSSIRAFLYKNGILDKQNLGLSDNMASWSSDLSFYIGVRNANGELIPCDYFSGSIDDVRIYNRALAPNQVKSLYTLGRYNRKRFLLSADQLKL